MPFCSQCGREVSQTAKFCVECGAAIAERTFEDNTQWRPLRRRGNWVLALTALYIVLAVVSIGSGLAEIELIQRMERGESITIEAATANDNRQAVVAFIYFITYLALAVAFLKWIYRAAENLAVIHPAEQLVSPGWAVGWWFIPIANLWKPYQVMTAIWKGSDPNSSPAPRIILIWWCVWLLSDLMALISDISINFDDLAIEELIRFGQLGVVADALSIVAAVLLFYLVRRIGINQTEKYIGVKSFYSVAQYRY